MLLQLSLFLISSLEKPKKQRKPVSPSSSSGSSSGSESDSGRYVWPSGTLNS